MRALRPSKVSSTLPPENRKTKRLLRQPRVLDAPWTWLTFVGLLASRARLRFTRRRSRAQGKENEGRNGCIGPSSLEEEALALQGQPEQPIGPADSAGVALNEAACAARRSNQNTRCQDLAVLSGGWIPADGNHEGMDMGCSRTRKERLDNLARQDRDDPTPYPTPWEYEHRPKEVLRDFKTHAMRVKHHSPEKIPGPTLDRQSSFRDGLRTAISSVG